MWYKQAKPFVESGDLAILGVIQEQHADRAKLYKQWKQFDFPIVQDATTKLDLAVVPIPLLIDEHGIVRNSKPKPGDLEAFINHSFEAPTAAEKTTTKIEAQTLISQGNQALESRDEKRIAEAIRKFEQLVEQSPENGKALFSLGVAYRSRFDSSMREESDFANASKYWSEALATNPNQYIWRRRIEQYGPRQIKPYPFYDWVDKAVEAIEKRGETPVKLVAPLTGSEIAKPSKKLPTSDEAKNPDPEAKIFADENKSVAISATTVPAIVKKGSMVRIHLNFDVAKGKWNNEATPLRVWIHESSSGKPESRLLVHDASQINSANSKYIDFEFQTDKESQNCKIIGYALYHTCDDEGVCYYYRQNFTIPIKTR